RVRYSSVVFQVNLFVFHGSPQPLGENVVQRASTSIHADHNARALQSSCELLAGELCSLIGIEDLRLRFLQSTIQRRQTEARVQRDRDFPLHDIAAEPVQNRHQIHESTPQSNVSDNRCSRRPASTSITSTVSWVRSFPFA